MAQRIFGRFAEDDERSCRSMTSRAVLGGKTITAFIRLLPVSRSEKGIHGNSFSVCRRGEDKKGRLTEEGDTY
ncbi:hypothetical protein TNCV_4153201 [Trichonephila clavipes]|nr:hypothetical protein TNCV_4153201 [Trichonephila clavipes]